MTCLQNLPSACDLHCLLSLSVICSPGKHQIWHILLKYGQTACRSPSSEFAMTCLQNWLPACDLHCSPRFGVYFLRGSYSCVRPFSENLRLCGAVSRWCRAVPTTILGGPAIVGYSVSQSTFILVRRCPHDRCPGAAVSLWCEAPTRCGSLQAPGPLRQVSLCQWAPLSIKSGSWDGRHLWQRWTRHMLLDLVLR